MSPEIPLLSRLLNNHVEALITLDRLEVLGPILSISLSGERRLLTSSPSKLWHSLQNHPSALQSSSNPCKEVWVNRSQTITPSGVSPRMLSDLLFNES